MHIDKLQLVNFKSFRELSLPLGRITLITGANSSGKSSAIGGLLGALQTDSFPLYYSPNGDYANMGDYAEMIHRHDRQRHFSIQIDTRSGDARIGAVAEYRENPINRMPLLVHIAFRAPGFELEITRDGDKYRASFKRDPEKDPVSELRKDTTFRAFMDVMARLEEATDQAASKGKSKRKRPAKDSPFTRWDREPDNEGTFEFKALSRYYEASTTAGALLAPTLRSLTSTFAEMNRKFNFVSSFRLAPQRTYYQVSRAALKVGKYGENAIDQLSEWEARKAPELVSLKKYLRSFKLLSNIRTNRMKSGRFEIIVTPFRGSVRSSLLDVGFGVSQFLPVLIADLQLGKESTLAVSQPEIHLHPSVQADLGNYFADRVREDRKRYILETHSEYLINRLRLLIAQGALKENDVTVVYLRGSKEGSEAHRVYFRKSGVIEGAPDDFFETYMMDVMDIAMAAVMKPDIFIDNNVAKNLCNPLSDEYKALLSWLRARGHLVVTQKLLREYHATSGTSRSSTNIVAMVALLQREGRLIAFGPAAIKTFRIPQRVQKRLRSNKADWVHIVAVLLSQRRLAISADRNLRHDINKYPGGGGKAVARPSAADYERYKLAHA